MTPTSAELIAQLQRQIDAWMANEAILFASEREQLALYCALVETLRAEGDGQPKDKDAATRVDESAAS